VQDQQDKKEKVQLKQEIILIQELTKQEEDGSVEMPKKKTTRKKKSTVNKAGNYTKPTMRKRLFSRIKSGTKGGKAGQWSARKAQMLAKAYKKAGGGYR
jgi:hypothetical protein